jgi:hypothetical protein
MWLWSGDGKRWEKVESFVCRRGSSSESGLAKKILGALKMGVRARAARPITAADDLEKTEIHNFSSRKN